MTYQEWNRIIDFVRERCKKEREKGYMIHSSQYSEGSRKGIRFILNDAEGAMFAEQYTGLTYFSDYKAMEDRVCACIDKLKATADEKKNVAVPCYKKERVDMVRAMEMIARAVNDELVFEYWLVFGVADGDIDETTTDDELEYYVEDETFAEIMDTFLNLMVRAKKSGGLYFNGIVSKEVQ